MSLGVVVEVSDSARVERGTPPDDSVNLAANCMICVYHREIVFIIDRFYLVTLFQKELCKVGAILA